MVFLTDKKVPQGLAAVSLLWRGLESLLFLSWYMRGKFIPADPVLSTPGIIPHTKDPEASSQRHPAGTPTQAKGEKCPSGQQVPPSTIFLIIPDAFPGEEFLFRSLQHDS